MDIEGKIMNFVSDFVRVCSVFVVFGIVWYKFFYVIFVIVEFIGYVI